MSPPWPRCCRSRMQLTRQGGDQARRPAGNMARGASPSSLPRRTISTRASHSPSTSTPNGYRMMMDEAELRVEPAKGRTNLRRHRVSFREAVSVFADPFSITIADPVHSEQEERLILVGATRSLRLLVVVHTERDARRAWWPLRFARIVRGDAPAWGSTRHPGLRAPGVLRAGQPPGPAKNPETAAARPHRGHRTVPAAALPAARPGDHGSAVPRHPPPPARRPGDLP